MASLFTLSLMGKPGCQLSSQPAKRVTSFFQSCSAFLNPSMWGILGVSGPFWASLCEFAPLRSFLRSIGPVYASGCSASDLEPKAGLIFGNTRALRLCKYRLARLSSESHLCMDILGMLMRICVSTSLFVSVWMHKNL